MIPLMQILRTCDEEHTALGHFNISDLVMLRAVVDAAETVRVPVMVGASEGEREFIGVRQIAALVRSIREEHDLPLFLNADHTHTLTKAIEAARAGFDEITFDASALPFDQNVLRTREAVEAIKAIDPSVVVEGEIGDIGSGSAVHDAPPALRRLSTPEEARQFVAATKVDVLAPAVGNMHGMLVAMVQGTQRKRLDVERINEIKAAAPLPLTLHGASATDDDDLGRAIRAGITIVHVSTELRVAWRAGIEAALADQPSQVATTKLLAEPCRRVTETVLNRLRLFVQQPR